MSDQVGECHGGSLSKHLQYYRISKGITYMERFPYQGELTDEAESLLI